MLSNKWTFSLKILVVMLAFVFVASSAMADPFSVGLSVAATVDDDANPDVSGVDGIQIITKAGVNIRIVTGQVVNIPILGIQTGDAAALLLIKDIASGHFTVTAFNSYGGTVKAPELELIRHSPNAANANGKNFSMQLKKADEAVVKVIVSVKAKVFEVADPTTFLTDAARNDDGRNAAASITINYVGAEPENKDEAAVPTVYSIRRLSDSLLPVTAATENVIILLSEQPKAFTKDNVDVTNATWIDPVALVEISEDKANEMLSTGRNNKLYPYVLTITPTYPADEPDIVVKVKAFDDMVLPTANKYTPPTREADYVEGESKLTIKVGKEDPKDKTGGFEVLIPKEIRIPNGGYLVAATDIGGSGIKDNPENDKDEPKASARTPAQLLYNVIALGDLPNLETFLANGGTIDLIAPNDLVISEIMWGSDASLSPSNNSQWIEVANSGTTSILTGDKTHKLIFYGPNETLPAVSTVADRVGTVGAGGYWSIAGKGQGGRSGTDEKATAVVAVVPTQDIVSMQRSMAADGTPADGTMASSWAESTAPALNFDATKVGVRVGTPGAAPAAYPVAPPPEPVVTPDPPAEAADIMITEIMVDTGGGRLPQWIELSNVSGKKVSLAGWSVEITNSDADADAVGSSVSIDLSGSLGVSAHAGNTGKGQSLLLVAWGARSSSKIKADLVMNVSSQVDETGRYTLISEMAFTVALVPPQTSGILTYGDTAGNLDEGWELPTDEGARSSLIRREMDAGMATMGTMANGWVLASDTPLVKGPVTWYGSDEDAGTPGYDAGGPLPVELSHFRPARDDAGAVVITWSTQSELNNAGFFIKRSQQRDGEFQIINATMIAGAGTTSEKQFYTYEDTTAQPNVVYYYQIEDVSLDGNRQTLTNGIRLKGHIGAAGKLTTMWGDLKTQE